MRSRPGRASAPFLALGVFVVAFVTFCVAISIVSPADDGAAGRSGVPGFLVTSIRMLLLSGGSAVSPRATAVLITLAWLSLTAMVVAVIAFRRAATGSGGDDPYH